MADGFSAASAPRVGTELASVQRAGASKGPLWRAFSCPQTFRRYFDISTTMRFVWQALALLSLSMPGTEALALMQLAVKYHRLVYFSANSARIDPKGVEDLQALACAWGTLNGEIVLAIGHATPDEGITRTQQLSEERANSVARQLASLGIGSRIYAEGKAHKQPAHSNKHPEGRDQNRRVEIEIIGTAKSGAISRSLDECHPMYRRVVAGDVRAMEGQIARWRREDRQSGRDAAIAMAVDAGRLDVVRHFTAQGGDLNQRLADAPSLLHLALRKGHIDVARFLVLRGIRPGTYTGDEGVLFAALCGDKRVAISNLRILDFLLLMGAPPGARKHDGTTALHCAMALANPDMVDALVRAGADINSGTSPNEPGGTAPVFRAPPDMAFFRLLESMGVDLSRRNIDGTTLLHVHGRNYELATWLLERDIDVNARSDSGVCALSYSLAQGRRVVELFVRHGADVNCFAIDGTAPIHYAAGLWIRPFLPTDEGRAEIVKLLLDHGARTDTSAPGGDQAIHIAAGSGSSDVVELLLRNGADPNALGGNDATPLHRVATRSIAPNRLAAAPRIGGSPRPDFTPDPVFIQLQFNSRSKVISALLAAGARRDAKNKQGKKPFELAPSSTPEERALAELLR